MFVQLGTKGRVQKQVRGTNRCVYAEKKTHREKERHRDRDRMRQR